MAKRNCRRTANEREVHDRAVKMKRMTDEQLCAYIETQIAEAGKIEYQKGYNAGCEYATANRKNSAMEFIIRLQGEKVRGIGAITINKLMEKANEYGYC